ncbi:hypothetical protein [Desulfofustis glycolicus]|uniref:hypothetical protein n=1 Tax=Desulfofustis glycolicus TaxID=51195 RepID=UPI0011610904|nr:hypothetical protein [Desulfofustis glycolicus]MCB2218264.1 hypothetical protein [Desulfobulbaceae bacterium]
MKISAVAGRSGWFLKVSGGQVKTCPADFHMKKKQKILGWFTANIEIRSPSGIIAELRSLKNNHQSGCIRPTLITSLKRNEDHATHSKSYRAGTDLSSADQHTTPQLRR